MSALKRLFALRPPRAHRVGESVEGLADRHGLPGRSELKNQQGSQEQQARRR